MGIYLFINILINRSPLSLSKLTTITLNMDLTHLGSEASIYFKKFCIWRPLSLSELTP